MINLGRGPTLPPPASVDFDRYIVEATAMQKAKYYKKVGLWPAVSWHLMTPDQTGIEFVEYSAIDLLGAYEAQL